MRRYEIEEISRREADDISKDRYVEVEQQRNCPISCLPEGLRQVRDISSSRCFDNPILGMAYHRVSRTALGRATTHREPSYVRGSRFTLVELILVSVILSVVGIAVYTAFSNGIRLWKRINQESPQEDVSVFFAKISYDLRNFVKHSTVTFSGKSDSISFATFIISKKKEGVEKGLGMVSYCFEKREAVISKQQSNYSQLYLAKPGPADPVLEGVSYLTFRYYCYDTENEEYIWLDAWDADEAPPGVKVGETLPLSVMVEIGLNEYQDEKFCAIVPILVGG